MALMGNRQMRAGVWQETLMKYKSLGSFNLKRIYFLVYLQLHIPNNYSHNNNKANNKANNNNNNNNNNKCVD